jgi:hypothetical protein
MFIPAVGPVLQSLFHTQLKKGLSVYRGKDRQEIVPYHPTTLLFLRTSQAPLGTEDGGPVLSGSPSIKL